MPSEERVLRDKSAVRVSVSAKYPSRVFHRNPVTAIHCLISSHFLALKVRIQYVRDISPADLDDR